MTVEELKEKLNKGEDMMMLDVREKDEAEAAGDMIQGSENVPMGKVFVEAAQGKLPKDKKIVTICKTGGRCEIVARELKEKGYDIDHLEGGIEAWKKSAPTGTAE
ncbi:MAG: rhodanese-like domain-containing protein [Patescibacteria group bacterium]|nr:rhodanese-like domain-containing protein [Patescibacteria group bacterium]MDE2438624.1 rhodanese-like domain-containing protein [Patescibacteria group bacterium]